MAPFVLPCGCEAGTPHQSSCPLSLSPEEISGCDARYLRHLSRQGDAAQRAAADAELALRGAARPAAANTCRASTHLRDPDVVPDDLDRDEELARRILAEDADLEIIPVPTRAVTPAAVDAEADRTTTESLAEKLFCAAFHAESGVAEDCWPESWLPQINAAFHAAAQFVAERNRRRNPS